MDELKILGKFNYISYKPGLYDLLFIPFFGAGAVIIAKNMTWQEMDKLKGELNESLAITRDEAKEGITDVFGHNEEGK